MKIVFISHSKEDANKVKALKKAIGKYESEFKTIVIIDQKIPGQYFTEKVTNGLDKCDIICPIITKKSFNNQWVNQEIGYAFAKKKSIIPIVSNSVLEKLKGFINSQLDCPFRFDQSTDKSKEATSFRKAYKELIDHILNIGKTNIRNNGTLIFDSKIHPEIIKQGGTYTTKVKFSGNIKNGFFDNFIEHLDSPFRKWNWDKSTLPKSGHTDPGTLNGKIDITTEYQHSTKNWPIGKYLIHVRLYEHTEPGKRGRKIVAQNIHKFEVR